MSTILFYIPNPNKIQKINVDVKTLMLLHEEIASVCQGIQAAIWTDSIIEEVISYIWGGKEQDFQQEYLYPGYTVKEIKESLKRIKNLAELTKWFPYNNEHHLTFTPLLEALEEYKQNKVLEIFKNPNLLKDNEHWEVGFKIKLSDN